MSPTGTPGTPGTPQQHLPSPHLSLYLMTASTIFRIFRVRGGGFGDSFSAGGRPRFFCFRLSSSLSRLRALGGGPAGPSGSLFLFLEDFFCRTSSSISSSVPSSMACRKRGWESSGLGIHRDWGAQKNGDFQRYQGSHFQGDSWGVCLGSVILFQDPQVFSSVSRGAFRPHKCFLRPAGIFLVSVGLFLGFLDILPGPASVFLNPTCLFQVL